MDLYSNPVDEERDAWEFTVIPRITRTLRVRVYPLERHPPSQGWSTRAASAVEFSVANPAAGPVPRPAMAAYPDNEFQPLPLTQRASGLKITLLGLSPTPDAPDDLRPACLVSTAVRFRVVEDGKPTTLWRPYAITIKDRSGTVWEPEVSYSSDATAPGEVWARLRGRVCTDGGPYKLEAWFMQGGTGNYAEFFVKQ
jgi:hypothetical protein